MIGFSPSHLFQHGVDVLAILLELVHGHLPVLGLGGGGGRGTREGLDAGLGDQRPKS